MYLYYLIIWRKPAHPGKIIWVAPHSISTTIEFSKAVKRRRYYFNGIIGHDIWYKRKKDIEYYHGRLFKAFEERYSSNMPFTQSEYFKKMDLDDQLILSKAKEYEIRYTKLVTDIKKYGFNVPSTIFDETDDFKISIDDDGTLLFMTGKHRLAIARLLPENIKIPVKVSFRHTSWQVYRDELFSKFKDGILTERDIINIGHPDLLDIIE